MSDNNIENLPPHIRQQAIDAAKSSGVASQAKATMQEGSIEQTQQPQRMREYEAEKAQKTYDEQQQQEHKPEK